MTAITTRRAPYEWVRLRDTTAGWHDRGIAAGFGWTTPAHPRVALVGTYPPTQCGLATFTSNLRAAIVDGSPGWVARIVRVLDHDEPERSPEVIAHWVAGDQRSLARALEALDSFDAVLLQHEYGLFGGPEGDEVIPFVKGLRSPLIAVLHTAMRSPTPHQRYVLEEVIDAAAVVVVQSEAARQRILDVHGTRPDKVVVIPHGAAANFEGPVRGDIVRPAILTWGLLGPGKGIEEGIEALHLLRRWGASPSYYVAGQTHPKVRVAQGEDYRETLRERARSLGVADRVHFDNCYRDWDSLRRLVRSVDVVLLPYHSREQVSSGVLVEAVASAKPVVSTRFPHAEELLADGAGLLVDHGDVDAMAKALHRVLYEPGLAARMSAKLRDKAQPLLWPAVGASYRMLIDQVVEAQAAA